MIQHSCLIFGWSVDQSLKETITQQHAILTHTHFHNPNRHTHGHTNRRRSFLLWYPLIYKAALISNISIFYTKCLSCSWWPNMEKKWKFLPSCVILHKYENYWRTQTCDQTLKCRQIPKDSFCKKGKQEFWKKELLTGQTFVVQVGWCWAHVAEDPWKYKKWQVCVCVCVCGSRSAQWEFSQEAADHLPAPLIMYGSYGVTDAEAVLPGVLLTSIPSLETESLGWGENKFVALWNQQTNGRKGEELRESKDGTEEREWGILCNRVENTKEGQMPLLF